MLTMPIDPEEMHLATEIFCAPMTLVINFSLFQYLTTFYFKRRNEGLGRLLISTAFLGFAALVPYTHPNEKVAGHLNDISETSTALTFLIQIVIVGRDVNRKVRIRSLKFISWIGEVLILIGILVIVLNFIEVTLHNVDISMFDGLDNIFEYCSLWFIFVARFYYVVISRGWKEIVKRKKLETMMYLLFVTHEYPFLLLEDLTGTTWEGVQALWNRLTVVFCIILTIQEKLRSITSKQSKLNTNMNSTRGPQEKSIFVSDADGEGPVVSPSKRSKASKGTSIRAPSLESILPVPPSLRSIKVGSSVLPKLR